MTAEERNTWIYVAVALVVPVVYGVYVAGRLADVGVADFDFVRPLLTAVGISILLGIVLNAAVGTATRDVRTDERDREIHRRGEYVGFFVLAYGMLPAFVLALFEAEHFWIAHAMYAAYIANAVTSSGVKLIAYRRGF